MSAVASNVNHLQNKCPTGETPTPLRASPQIVASTVWSGRFELGVLLLLLLVSGFWCPWRLPWVQDYFTHGGDKALDFHLEVGERCGDDCSQPQFDAIGEYVGCMRCQMYPNDVINNDNAPRTVRSRPQSDAIRKINQNEGEENIRP